MKIQALINGKKTSIEAPPGETLLYTLRRAGFKSVKNGCEEGECGACAVILDGRLVNSCLVLAGSVEGKNITTVEGLGTPDAPHPIQVAFADAGAVQCGYCTPGMVLAAKALLDKEPDPTEEAIREAISGNLCRCTGYVKIVEAIRAAAKAMSPEPAAPAAEPGPVSS